MYSKVIRTNDLNGMARYLIVLSATLLLSSLLNDFRPCFIDCEGTADAEGKVEAILPEIASRKGLGCADHVFRRELERVVDQLSQ